MKKVFKTISRLLLCSMGAILFMMPNAWAQFDITIKREREPYQEIQEREYDWGLAERALRATQERYDKNYAMIKDFYEMFGEYHPYNKALQEKVTKIKTDLRYCLEYVDLSITSNANKCVAEIAEDRDLLCLLILDRDHVPYIKEKIREAERQGDEEKIQMSKEILKRFINSSYKELDEVYGSYCEKLGFRIR